MYVQCYTSYIHGHVESWSIWGLLLGKEAMFVVEAIHYKFWCWRWHMLWGSIICSYSLQSSIVGIMVRLEVVMMCLMLCYVCWLLTSLYGKRGWWWPLILLLCGCYRELGCFLMCIMLHINACVVTTVQLLLLLEEFGWTCCFICWLVICVTCYWYERHSYWLIWIVFQPCGG